MNRETPSPSGYFRPCLASGKHDAVDPTKIAGELRASSKHDGHERTVIRLEVDRIES